MKVNMSPRGITARLRQVDELNKLCLALGRSRLIDDRDPKTRPVVNDESVAGRKKSNCGKKGGGR